MKKSIYTLMLISFFITNSCMAAVKSKQQQMLITSAPTGANIFVEGQYQGKTPRSLPLQHHRSPRIVVQKNGYKPQYIDLKPRTYNAVSNNQNINYGIFPIAGTAIGAGTGLVMTGGTTSDLAGIVVAGTAGIGFIAGSAIGLAGLLYHSKKKQPPQKVHFRLQQDKG